MSRSRKIAVAVIAAALIGLAGLGGSGASWVATDTGNVSVKSGNLTVELSDSDNVGTFKLAYDNIYPGDVQADKFTVKNTGSIPGSVKIGQPFSGISANLGNANPAKLMVGIDGYQPVVMAPSLTGDINLGTLNPGQERTYTVRVGLDQSAGDEWMNRSLSTNVTVTLQQ